MSSTLNDVMQFKVPIPSSFIRRNQSVAVQNTDVSNSLSNDYFMPKPSNTPSLWGGSVGRKEKQVRSRNIFNPMPPPPVPSRGLYHSIHDETNMTSNFFYGSKVVHSTPQHRNVGIGISSSSLQGVPDSMIYHSGWNGSASAYHRGSESVRSYNSVSTEYVDKIFTKALNKYLEKNNVNPDVHDLAIHVANGLRACAQEAVLELGAPDSSCRSVYSEKGSTWRSGVSVASGRSQETFNSLLKKGRAVQKSLKDTACSIQCSVAEKTSQSRRPHQTRTIEEKNKLNATAINVIEKAMQPTSLSAEVDSSDDECVIPQTVRRNPTAALPVSPVVQVFGSPTIANMMNDIALEKQEKMKQLESIKDRQNTSSTPQRKKNGITNKIKRTYNRISSTKIEVTKKTNRQAKRKSVDVEADTSCITTSIIATTTVQCTRSGRNVKKPSFYQVPQKNKPLSRLKGKGVQQEETTSIGIKINVSDKTHNITYTKNIKHTKPNDSSLKKVKNTPHPKPKARPKNKNVMTSAAVLNTIVENVVHTRSGRAVKPIKIYQLNESHNDSHIKSSHLKTSKENTPPKAKKTKRTKKVPVSNIKSNAEDKIINEPMLVEEDNDDGCNLDVSNLSFGGADFFIPAVTQSTRRAGVKSLAGKALRNVLGAQTPPLVHLTAHLPSNLVGSSTPSQQTPDWQISQRSQSELMEFQKRKVSKKNKNLKIPLAKKKLKPTKGIAKAMKLLNAPRQASPMIPATRYCSDSDDSECSL